MLKSSPGLKLLPLLGVVLAIVLTAVAMLLSFGGTSGGGADDGIVGRLIAEAQAARTEARAALSGSAEAFGALGASRGRLADYASAAAAADLGAAARALARDEGLRTVDASLAVLEQQRDPITSAYAARDRLLELTPALLAAVGNAVSALPPADLARSAPYLQRLELTVAGVQQDARGLAGADAAGGLFQRLGAAEEDLSQLLRALRGEDPTLGIAPAAGASLAEANELFEQVRTAIADLTGQRASFTAAAAAAAELDAAAGTLLERYRAANLGAAGPAAGAAGAVGARLPLVLLGTALVIVVMMLFIYYRARDFGRAAELQAAQNERNQQAILRLLDELSSLADGDLTVKATVTEDITGAIADSINYAIEALRGLVATINESSILLDSAAKQTEGSARQLLRASETQAKQAAAASDSMSQMAASIEEVSGNAERCSDVARHAVDVAHKGGEAVRRTIEGMNTIRETIQDTSKRIKRLGESSQEIGNIVELIEEIAEQTNILALNASIEASRAGESSRGFAVVADEVQKLAERSANATKKIEVLVSTIQSDTNEAVVSMERSTTDVVGGALLAENAGAALDEIEQVSHQIASLVQNISGSSRSQAGVGAAITKNMQVLREISLKTTESMAATTAAISKLSVLASELRSSVEDFTLPEQRTQGGVLGQTRPGLELAKLEQQPPEEAADESVERRRLSV